MAPGGSTRLERLARRDGWECWLCGGELDPDLPTGHPDRPSADHVVPRSRGGRTTDENLRLAHRSCNTRRGDHLPELAWPDDLLLVDREDLWRVIARAVAGSGEPQLAAIVATEESAREASKWAVTQACAFVGGRWTGEVRPLGEAGFAVDLSVSGARSPGRPRSPRSRSARGTRRRHR